MDSCHDSLPSPPSRINASLARIDVDSEYSRLLRRPVTPGNTGNVHYIGSQSDTFLTKHEAVSSTYFIINMFLVDSHRETRHLTIYTKKKELELFKESTLHFTGMLRS